MLSADQTEALEKLLEFVFEDNENRVFVLSGKPGVGKTYLLSSFLDEVDKRKKLNYAILAPTHKSAEVLSSGVGREVLTLHRFLNLSPKLDILDLDFRDLEFLQKSFMNYFGLIICDEASMINNFLYEKLLELTQREGTKLVFVGDELQLKPVNSLDVSQVFSNTNVFKLTTNHRQDNQELTNLVEATRLNFLLDFEPYVCDTVKTFTSAKEMMVSAIEDFQISSNLQYAKFCKILTYTNERVNSFNQYVHRKLSADGDEYIFNEILTGYSSTKNGLVKNSKDYVVKNVEHRTMTLPGFMTYVNVYKLLISDVENGTSAHILVLPRDTEPSLKEQLAKAIDTLRIRAISNRTIWSNYYALCDSFYTPFDLIYNQRLIKSKSIDYGYSMSIHKSQSSSYDIVYFDNSSLKFCYDKKEKQMLQHVGISRTRSNVNILI
jgi:ATP-dependent exoDNAse (exonuclease V) alpha subunit